jgi:hypothetical protein
MVREISLLLILLASRRKKIPFLPVIPGSSFIFPVLLKEMNTPEEWLPDWFLEVA